MTPPDPAPFKLPIATSDLYEWLPHRPPMVWIDEVSSFDQTSGECAVALKDGGLYLEPDGSLRPSSVIEFIAQGFGYLSAAQALANGLSSTKRITKAFLVAVSRARIGDCTKVRAGTRLRVKLGNLKQVGPVTILDGQVLLPNGEPLADANLKVYGE